MPLHVRSHQRAVGVVVLEERNERRRDGYDLFRRNVHVVYPIARHRQNVVGLFVVTDDNHIFRKRSVFIQLRVRLGHDVVVFFIGRQVVDMLGNHTRLRIDPTVRSFDEAVLVDAGERRQGVDQTDVRTFRRFDRTHPAVVTVVNVADFEACALTRQTARSERGQTAFMRQFRKRVRLVHELRKLGASEELLD